MFADAPSTGPAVEADFTLSLEVPKRGFLIPENQQFVGEWVIIPIGLDQQMLGRLESDWSITTAKEAATLLRPRRKFDHKGTFGHPLIVAGSYGKAGAAILASKAAMRSGAGLVTCHVPGILNPILQAAIPEVMVNTDTHQFHFSGIVESGQYTAIGMGCGIGQHSDTVKALEELLESVNVPLVLDADALNILSQHQHLLKRLPRNTILTPHPKEFERLFGKSENHFDRLSKLREVSLEYQVIFVLKGAHTAIASPTGHVHFNTTGNPGMATAGSGDVLTGILTGIVGQGIVPLEAAILGVYLHGLAGDIAADEKGYEALIASDIIEHLGSAFQYLSASANISSDD
jgi:NAD(P)H-hydrate epimerase